ncbi:MAG: hypothetical protein GXP30_10100 [Verrucomicrobia bacterium]|nr:hypothetical protein [Verrucomicrobiota bacterium]
MKSPLLKTAACLVFVTSSGFAAEPIKLGNRLELFVDDYLVEKTTGDVKQHLMKPEPKEVVLVADSPWEGNTSGYYSFFKDGGLFRTVYRGWQHDEKMKAEHKEVTCYAESKDGIHWTKPNLGLFEWKGSKENNIVWLALRATHNFTAYRNDNPAAPKEARYLALGGLPGSEEGLLAFQSPDCKNWQQIGDKPVITHGAFDSQNLAFWDTIRNEYRAYWRIFTKGVTTKKDWKPEGFRAIRTATSKDFKTWENEADLTYTEGTPAQHLYTNAIQSYERAPHLFIGFPTRFLPKEGERVEPVLMTSRDGVKFNRWSEPVITEDAPKDRKGNRSNYMTWGMFQLPGKPKELSVYATENYYEKTPGRVRRFAYRVDGFVAMRGGEKGGGVLTKTLSYKGKNLLLNYVVREGGSLTVEVLDQSGKVIGKSKVLQGDVVDSVVEWENDPDFEGGVVQLRLSIKNADVFSLKFSD